MLRARGEHAIRLETALGHQVVDHDADVGLIAAEDDRSLMLRAPSAALSPATRPCPAASSYPDVPLICPARKSPATRWVSSVASQLGRLDEVVFDRVARAQHVCDSSPGSDRTSRSWSLAGQAHREAVDVDLLDVETFGLEKELMPLPIRESHHLVFERRAVSRADSGNLAVEERRLADVAAHQLMNLVCRVEQMANDLISRAHVSRRTRTATARIIAMFHVEHPLATACVEVDRAPAKSRRRAGLQPAPLESKRLERFSQVTRRRFAGTAGWPLFAPDVNQAVEECPGRDDQRRAADLGTILESETDDPASLADHPPRPSEHPFDPWLTLERGPNPVRCIRRLSAWARGDQTAGPRLRLSILNCKPVASMARPISPPSASISLTRWPLAVPPTAGLQGIKATVCLESVQSATEQPSRAAAQAASTPACPAPITATSNLVIKVVLTILFRDASRALCH